MEISSVNEEGMEVDFNAAEKEQLLLLMLLELEQSNRSVDLE